MQLASKARTGTAFGHAGPLRDERLKSRNESSSTTTSLTIVSQTEIRTSSSGDFPSHFQRERRTTVEVAATMARSHS